MQDDSPSVTAQGAAIMRALHQEVPQAERILDDPIAPLLVARSPEAVAARRRLLSSLPEPVRLRLTNFVLRSRYAEDALCEAALLGIEQYVVLGAGLDTFAYRQPPWAERLRIFEVDHPATQRWKRSELVTASVSVPDNVVYAPVDFAVSSLKECLAAAGVDLGRPTFFSLLGVSQYLTSTELNDTLSLVASCPRESEVVLSFVVPDELLSPGDAELVGLFVSRFAAIGEPWLTRIEPGRLAAQLSRLGFSTAEHLSPTLANERYFRSRSDGLSACILEQMILARV
jgi:methyltransferase (TIGR00027 family)